MRLFSTAAAALGLVASLAVASPAAAQYGMDKKPPKNTATPELPHCDRPIGTAAIQEPEKQWWTELGLSSPESLLKLFAMRSGCLRIVDRNGGLAMRNMEKGLGESGVIPVAAAVRNAIKDAIGERFTELPITPECVRASIQRAATRHPR